MDSTEVAVLDCKFLLLAHNFIGVTYIQVPDILIPSICFPFGRNPSFPCTLSSSEPQRLNLNGYQIFYVMQWVLCISGIFFNFYQQSIIYWPYMFGKADL